MNEIWNFISNTDLQMWTLTCGIVQFISYLRDTILTNHNSNREALKDIWYNLPLTRQGSLWKLKTSIILLISFFLNKKQTGVY